MYNLVGENKLKLRTKICKIKYKQGLSHLWNPGWPKGAQAAGGRTEADSVTLPQTAADRRGAGDAPRCPCGRSASPPGPAECVWIGQESCGSGTFDRSPRQRAAGMAGGPGEGGYHGRGMRPAASPSNQLRRKKDHDHAIPEKDPGRYDGRAHAAGRRHQYLHPGGHQHRLVHHGRLHQRRRQHRHRHPAVLPGHHPAVPGDGRRRQAGRRAADLQVRHRRRHRC